MQISQHSLHRLVLFSFGTGAIKGFAVTLSIGIITSMFTAIIVSRAIINIIYGGKKVEELVNMSIKIIKYSSH